MQRVGLSCDIPSMTINQQGRPVQEVGVARERKVSVDSLSSWKRLLEESPGAIQTFREVFGQLPKGLSAAREKARRPPLPLIRPVCETVGTLCAHLPAFSSAIRDNR